MTITFINPDTFTRQRSTDVMQPLAIAALAAHTPEHYLKIFFDERLEDIDFDIPTDMVVISVMTFTARRSYAISAVYRAKGIPVILGGFHPSLLPEEASLYADCVVTGDVEPLWHTVLSDFEKGILKNRYDAGVCVDPGQIRYDRSIFRGKKYSPMTPVQIGRGCMYACDFCSIHSFYGDSIVTRPVADIAAELSQIQNRYIFFTDDNLLAVGSGLSALLEALVPLKKKWSCQISVDASCDTALLAAMRRSGCISVFVGFESMHVTTLTQMRKSANIRQDDYRKVVERFRASGLMVSGAFVFGYPGDTEDTVQAALRFALQNKLTLCHFNVLFPFPKTKVYERLSGEGRLKYTAWWTDSEFRYGMPMFEPETVDADRLSEACQTARRVFNSPFNILRRACDLRANARTVFNLTAFLVSNWISRREIMRKYGKVLG